MNHSHPDQCKGENAFGRSCATLRKRMHLTQRELGRLLEISEQAIQHWERGVYSPRLEHLKQFIELSIQRHAFTPGHEHEEAEHVWQAAQDTTGKTPCILDSCVALNKSTTGIGSSSGTTHLITLRLE